MKSYKQTKTALALVTLVGLPLAALPSHAGIIVDNSKIVSGSAVGTLAAIDVPYSPVRPASGGPDWSETADDGFTTVNSPIRDLDGTSKWEPDGTPIGEAQAYMVYNGGVPSVKWTFNQASAGIDLPDRTIIRGVYATWNTRGKDGITYQYTEGSQSGSTIRQAGGAGPAADLVLSWTDDVSTTRNGNFERIFASPIVVGGGDGFELWGTDNVGNASHIDAVVIDYQLPSVVPVIIANSPADGASGVLLATDIKARFDRDMSLTGTGTVTLRNLTPGSGADIVFNLPDSQVSVSGDTLTINPTANLNLGTDYAIRISGNALKDSDDTPFAGILEDTTWNFTTTSDNVPPTIATLYPADNATDVLPFLDLVATFGENVQLTGTGTVTIRNLTLGTETSITLPNSQVSLAGAVLRINPTSNLAFSTDYAVRISADAVVDFSANTFAGILDNTTWNFTTAGSAGGLVVDAGKIQNAVTPGGRLLIIDTPKTTGDDGNAAGIGFAGTTGGDHTGSGWEPDGTDDNTQWNTPWRNGGSVTYTFNLPDGAVINKIYHDWRGQGNQSAAVNYAYDEGTPVSTSKSHTVGPASDLVLQWTAADSSTHNVNFETIFTGPITVAGGNGFTVTVSGGLMALGAMLVDVIDNATITSFEAAGVSGTIDQLAKTIAVEVPFGTNLATLAPTYTLSSGICNQPNDGTTPPTPAFANATGNTVDYVVTDTATTPETVKTYAVTVTVAPQIATLVIDLGASPAGTTIAGGTFGTYVAASGFPTNLPLALPAGSILRSIAINSKLEATGIENYASDLSLLLDPTPGTPGGDFSVEITNGTKLFGTAGTLKLGWPQAANAGIGTSLADTKTAADWSTVGPIDLGTTGLFLGNAYGSAPAGGTWSGTITLAYEVAGGGSAYSNWSGGESFAGDKNGDGVRNGLAFLLGAANPDASALGLLPTPNQQNSGDLILNFSMRNAANRGASVLKLQWSTDLGLSDLWSTNEAVVPEVSGTVDGVTFVITPGEPLNGVVATIPAGEAAGGGKLFGRLQASE